MCTFDPSAPLFGSTTLISIHYSVVFMAQRPTFGPTATRAAGAGLSGLSTNSLYWNVGRYFTS